MKKIYRQIMFFFAIFYTVACVGVGVFNPIIAVNMVIAILILLLLCVVTCILTEFYKDVIV